VQAAANAACSLFVVQWPRLQWKGERDPRVLPQMRATAASISFVEEEEHKPNKTRNDCILLYLRGFLRLLQEASDRYPSLLRNKTKNVKIAYCRIFARFIF
ncbi:unnamed protein product, partial [Laminaria digitata]